MSWRASEDKGGEEEEEDEGADEEEEVEKEGTGPAPECEGPDARVSMARERAAFTLTASTGSVSGLSMRSRQDRAGDRKDSSTAEVPPRELQREGGDRKKQKKSEQRVSRQKW